MIRTLVLYFSSFLGRFLRCLFFCLEGGSQPLGTSMPKAYEMSSCLPMKGVIFIAFLVCSMHLIDRISSRISSEDENWFLREVFFQGCLR